MIYDTFSPDVYLCNRAQFQRYIQPSGDVTYSASNTALQDLFIAQASAEIVDMIKRLPLPYTATHYFNAIDVNYSVYEGLVPHLDLRTLLVYAVDDLLSVTTLTNGDGTTISSTEYVFAPANSKPVTQITLKQSSSTAWEYTTTPESAISVAGIWGYVPHYANAWRSASTLDGALNATSTSVPVVAGTAYDVLDYVQVDSEIMLITAISTNTLTVRRGVLGTTATTHDTATNADKFMQNNTIANACAEYGAYLYKTKDALGQNVEVYDGVTRVNNGLSQRLLASLKRHIRYSVTSPQYSGKSGYYYNGGFYGNR